MIITTDSSFRGVGAEYEYIRQALRRAGLEGDVAKQALLSFANGKHYDEITVRLSDSTEKKFYFDISAFFGRP